MKNEKSMSEQLKEWFDSDEGQEYVIKQGMKGEIKEKRFIRFEKYILENSFDDLIERLIAEHNDEYIDKCYSRGCEPYPNRKLAFLFDYISEKSQTVKIPELDCDFTNGIWCLGGYYFQIIWGQGAINPIYRKSDMGLLLQV